MERAKKILEEKRLKSSNRKPKYATRKLSIGMVSCLLGFLIFGSAHISYAEEGIVENPVEVVESVNAPNESIEDLVETETDLEVEEKSTLSVEKELLNAQNTSSDLEISPLSVTEEVVPLEEEATEEASPLAEETAEEEKAYNDKYEAYAKQGINFAQLEKVPEAIDFIDNKDELPSDIEVRWEDETVFNKLSKEVEAYAIVKYSDGTEDRVKVLFEISAKYEIDGVVYTGSSYSNELNLQKSENTQKIYQGTTVSNAVTEEERSKSEITVAIEDVHAANQSGNDGARDENGFITEKLDERIQYLEVSDVLARYIESVDGKNSNGFDFPWERVYTAEGYATNTWRRDAYNALAAQNSASEAWSKGGLFNGGSLSVEQTSVQTLKLTKTLAEILAENPDFENGDLWVRTFVFDNGTDKILDGTVRDNYVKITALEEDSKVEEDDNTPWFTSSSSHTYFIEDSGTNGGIAYTQVSTKDTGSGTLQSYGGQTN